MGIRPRVPPWRPVLHPAALLRILRLRVHPPALAHLPRQSPAQAQPQSPAQAQPQSPVLAPAPIRVPPPSMTWIDMETMTTIETLNSQNPDVPKILSWSFNLEKPSSPWMPFALFLRIPHPSRFRSTRPLPMERVLSTACTTSTNTTPL